MEGSTLTLANLHENARKADHGENAEFTRYGPAFCGDYNELSMSTLVLGMLSSVVVRLLGEHRKYLDDFHRLFHALGESYAHPESKDVKKVAVSAYIKAEQRLKAHAKALRAIGENCGNPHFAEGLEEAVGFPWNRVQDIEARGKAVADDKEEKRLAALASEEKGSAESGAESGAESSDEEVLDADYGDDDLPGGSEGDSESSEDDSGSIPEASDS